MKNSARFIVSILLVFVFFFNSLPSALACGPFTLAPFFSLKQHADFPLPEYTNGKMGIVPESFGQMSLFVFYRELNNQKLSKEAQKEVVEAMETQIYYLSGRYDKSSNDLGAPDYYMQWLDARAKVTDEKRTVE